MPEFCSGNFPPHLCPQRFFASARSPPSSPALSCVWSWPSWWRLASCPDSWPVVSEERFSPSFNETPNKLIRKQPTYQDAFVHVSVLHVETDPDDAAVVNLLVIQRQWQGRVVGHGRDGAFVRAWGRERCGAGDRGGGSAAGARGWTGAGTCSWGVQRRQRRALPKLEAARVEKRRWWRGRSGAPRSH